VRAFSLFIFIFAFSACSVLKSIESPSARYRNYLDDRVREAKIFDRGRSLVAIKAIYADDKLKQAQHDLTPGFVFPYDESVEQVLVAVDMTTWERFSKNDLKFKLDDIGANKVRELTNPIETETHYPFAHPHFRIFIVNFDRHPVAASSEKQLWVQTLRGDLKLMIPLGESEAQ